MTYSLKSIVLVGLLATAAPVAALAQNNTDAAGAAAGASTEMNSGVSGAAEGAGTDASASADMGASADTGASAAMDQGGSIKTYGQLIAGLKANGAASTDQFADYQVGTDGEVEIVALSDLQGEGAENGSAALKNATGSDVDADYSQLPDGVFDGTDYTADDVETAFIDSDGNLIVVVNGNT
ncbi:MULTISPECIES: hypothetical protein [Thioclava]|uniref:hypothetical protein n=1 Tax=Thioclava TaxID=285107 RepID=UPI000B545B57|nr:MULTISPECIES: hypothetical protein [Thioclava]OWY02919.1 hypothetical protein B6V76_08530 [Thioclava sp. IC9]WGT50436.1 hypothetical protein P0N61_19415 [Thioclava nitratireducens]